MTKQTVVVQELKNVFNAALQRNDRESLLKAFYAVEEWSLDLKDWSLLGSAYALLIGFFHKNDDIDQLIRYSVRFLDYGETYAELKSMEDYFSIASTLDFILEDHDGAMAHVYSEIEVHEKRGNQRGIAGRLCNIAEIQLLKQQNSQALNTALDAKMIYQELGLMNSMGGMICKSVLSKIYVKLGEPAKALKYLEELLLWSDIETNPHLMLEVHKTFGAYSEFLGQEQTTLDHYLEALAVAVDYGLVKEQTDLYRKLGEAYAAFGNYEEAYRYQSLYIVNMDNVISTSQSVLKVNAELELRLLNSEKENQQLREKGACKANDDKYDPLTGLFSEQYMMSLMGHMISQGQSTGSVFSIAVLKIPGIKALHEAEGLEVMDRRLMEVAKILESVKRKYHLLGRIAVDRFIVCLADERSEQARITMQGYVNALINRHPPIEVFGGIVDNSKNQVKEPGTMIRMADLALYQSEQVGSSRLSLW